MPPVAQRALTVVADVVPGKRDELVALLDASEAGVLTRLAAATTLHFGRFVVFDRAGGAASLALETNYDGPLDAHVRELVDVVGGDLDAFFSLCDGYTKGAFAQFAAGRSYVPNAYYIGHGGLSVAQIRNDRAVRAAIEAELDALDASGALSTMRPRDIAAALKRRLAKTTLTIGAVDRGLPKQPWSELSLYAMVPGMVLAAAALAIAALLVFEPADRRREAADPPKLLSDHDPSVSALIDAEDLSPQNGLTHVVAVKPGAYRTATLRFVLWVVEEVHKRVLFEGSLSGIASIHFARWVLLPDGTLVFFSNYDGSWESYLGDFIDKAHLFLTAIWTNTKWFPKTTALMFDGASAESAFKTWTRTFQVRNQIWYSAYADLTVTNVLNNEKIRRLAGGPLERDDEVKAWLALL